MSSPGGERFPSAARLTLGSEIEQVRTKGKRVRTASIEARVSASLRALSRVGIVVPKYGHNSVERNRLKRRLRELVRREWLPRWREASALDVVVRVLPAGYAREFDALSEEMRRLAERVERLRSTEPGASGEHVGEGVG
ncbi:MAG: ribonuclease P protein component [Gemmatimonadaceae bacterium]|nr:ribonuclease P protein component [Gemmatimonadaceae bacterium]